MFICKQWENLKAIAEQNMFHQIISKTWIEIDKINWKQIKNIDDIIVIIHKFVRASVQ